MSQDYTLTIEQGNDRGRTVPLPDGATVTVGRRAGAGLVIADAQASRRHAEVIRRGTRSGCAISTRPMAPPSAERRSA